MIIEAKKNVFDALHDGNYDLFKSMFLNEQEISQLKKKLEVKTGEEIERFNDLFKKPSRELFYRIMEYASMLKISFSESKFEHENKFNIGNNTVVAKGVVFTGKVYIPFKFKNRNIILGVVSFVKVNGRYKIMFCKGKLIEV